MNRIILAGGSGYLGMVLAEYYKNKVNEIIILTRGKNDWKDNIRWVHWMVSIYQVGANGLKART
ncbi:NAD(P)-dependent oxidoreductase [Sporocytophaga myxococcoides]|uniref:NAD(P)-dependent oxidoreductase n=1 Tax=Sporocytophaga myxococcoides TaxID=153721 RepID=UPI001B7F8BB2|nr:NAD(P)-dependent oxidoreductase [Sporocytophaga myxococcoides]